MMYPFDFFLPKKAMEDRAFRKPLHAHSASRHKECRHRTEGWPGLQDAVLLQLCLSFKKQQGLLLTLGFTVWWFSFGLLELFFFGTSGGF
jgi:hypothetical protein